MRTDLVATALLLLAAATGASARSHGDCSRWLGAYEADLVPDDTFTGNPTKLHLYVRKNSVGWNVTGEGVPEIILDSVQFRCTATRVSGKFEGTQQLFGTFKLTERGQHFVFDASDVGNEPTAGFNFLGYVPNRAVRVRKIN